MNYQSIENKVMTVATVVNNKNKKKKNEKKWTRMLMMITAPIFFFSTKLYSKYIEDIHNKGHLSCTYSKLTVVYLFFIQCIPGKVHMVGNFDIHTVGGTAASYEFVYHRTHVSKELASFPNSKHRCASSFFHPTTAITGYIIDIQPLP